MIGNIRPGNIIRHSIWLAVLWALAACNLNNPGDGLPQQVISGAPVVQIAAPLPNATFLQGVNVNIQARVSNAGTDISRVEVTVDETNIADLTTPNTAGAPAFNISQSWQAEGAGSHTISVTAYREDGTASAPASVTINVVGQVGAGATEEATSEATEEVRTAPPASIGNEPDEEDAEGETPEEQEPAEPTDVPEPTEPPATNTPSVPMATFTTGVNVRRGPGFNAQQQPIFNPPIGSFAANQTAEVLGISPDRQWYKVKYYNGEGWVLASLMTVAGDAANLPTDPGPATPIPVTDTPIPPTPVPVTNTPTMNINLVAGNIRTEPEEPRCNQAFNIFFDILNGGTDRWPGGGTIEVVDTAGGINPSRTLGAIPAIDPGQTVAVGPIPLTVSTNFDEEHVLALIIDPNNEIGETNNDDNRREKKYTLRKASC